MNSIDQVIADLRADAERALTEHPDKTPLDPTVTYEQALREYYQFCDSITGQVHDEPILFRTGQHVARMTMCAALEAMAELPASREQRAAAFLRFYQRGAAIQTKVAADLGYDV